VELFLDLELVLAFFVLLEQNASAEVDTMLLNNVCLEPFQLAIWLHVPCAQLAPFQITVALIYALHVGGDISVLLDLWVRNHVHQEIFRLIERLTVFHAPEVAILVLTAALYAPFARQVHHVPCPVLGLKTAHLEHMHCSVHISVFHVWAENSRILVLPFVLIAQLECTVQVLLDP
jgi:hypothetical protein